MYSYFTEVRLLEPQRLELMEIYSTVLWHLHAEVQLSTLAQDLVSQDRNSAAAWCATGNLFSAQTEHETAIKFFQRAIQVCYQISVSYIVYHKSMKYPYIICNIRLFENNMYYFDIV